MWNSAWARFGPWPRAIVLAQRPILAQGAGATVRVERGHHARPRSRQRARRWRDGGRLTVRSSLKAQAWSGGGAGQGGGWRRSPKQRGTGGEAAVALTAAFRWSTVTPLAWGASRGSERSRFRAWQKQGHSRVVWHRRAGGTRWWWLQIH
jgi:hypothetical protein